MTVREFRVDDYIVEFDETPELKEAVYNKVLQWFIDNELFHGEMVMQTDRGNIESVTVMTELADKFCFDLTYEE